MDTTQKKEEPKERTFGEMFDFSNIFRVKGKQGLVSVVSYKLNAPTCVVCDIYTPKTKRSVSVKKMVRLGDLEFIKTDYSKIGMQEAFTNISNYCIQTEDYAFENIEVEKLMDWMCPGYDEYHFKVHHAQQLLAWYIEITLKYSALIDDKVEAGEVELLTEDKK